MFMVQNFATVVQGIADHGVAGTLTHLCQLYATHNILHYSGDFLEVRKKLLYGRYTRLGLLRCKHEKYFTKSGGISCVLIGERVFS